MKHNLTKTLQALLLRAVWRAGTFKPSEALPFVEDSMTQQEHDDATWFLTWVHVNKHTFDHVNISEVWHACTKESP